MDGASREAIPPFREQAWEFVASVSNGASLRGLALVLLGGVVLMLPDATTSVAQFVSVVALGAAGLMDVFYALTGRRWLGRRSNRVLAFIRGLVSLVIVTLLIGIEQLFPEAGPVTLSGVIAALGVYVAARGLIAIIGALLRRGQPGSLPRLAGGGVALVGGVLAAGFPETIASAVLVSTAVVAMITGFILIAWGLRRADRGSELDPAQASIPQVLWDWVRGSDIGDDARGTQVEALYFENPGRHQKLGTWWVMLALSVAIATYAVLADSTAVVIGAMLVAPLMTPIVALAGALVNGWARRALHSAGLVGAGVVGSVALAYGLAAWSPVAITFSTNSQITSRVTPTTVDMLIALAAGAAGAYATVNTRVSSSIAGVAIAVALVPPLAVAGVSLSEARIGDAGGALLLFLTNFVAIVLAACAVFVLTGFARPSALSKEPRRVLLTLAPFVILAGLILLPLMFASEGQLSRSAQERSTERAVQDWLGEDSGFVIQDIVVNTDGVRVTIEGAGDPPDLSVLQSDLASVFPLAGAPALQLVVIPVTVTELPAPSTE
ncbi:DUF389 domain-containing protein [Demequina mangrovi]|uniref:Uncharacterized hydrophobic domain-containing protein n=1 Tax=Demequina mangrovi TaxID=1043493 RepID=A0A1H6YW22_9MICO|nr:DUF389 domain-containing protein [Demequina mangrovi]SEJ41490.1 uncharacterized hydrophobic domain-containing protein [Demequina mangrovi]